MKPKIKAIVIAWVAVLVLGSVVNAQTCFRDLSWGDPPAKLGETVLVYELQMAGTNFKIYTKVNEQLSFGTYEVKEIQYTFEDNRLSAITLYGDSVESLNAIAVEMYGAGSSKSSRAGTTVYEDESSVCEVFVLLSSATMTIKAKELPQ